MITFADLQTSLVSLLKETFPTVPIISQDVEKGFKRPSITVIVDSPVVETLDVADELSATIQIYYFPDLKNNNKSVDLIDVQYILPKSIGNKIAVKDRFIDVNEPSSNVVDGIYIFEFDTLFYNDIEEETAPLITDLNLNM